jgi:hypothetical protein
MGEFNIGLLTFGCLFGAAMLALTLHSRLRSDYRDQRTHDMVKLSMGMIVVMSSLVLGLLTASLKRSFDTVDSDVHKFGTQLLLLDRTLIKYGPGGGEARTLLRDYTAFVLERNWPKGNAAPVVDDDRAANILDDVDRAIQDLPTDTREHQRLAVQAIGEMRTLYVLRWTIIGESTGQISQPFLIILVFWLTLCFASFGYNAPRNPVVAVVLFLSAASIAGAIFLIVDLDTPFDGWMRISGKPVELALQHLRQ